MSKESSNRGGIPTEAPPGQNPPHNATIAPDSIVIPDVFQKKTGKTPPAVTENGRRRARKYDQVARKEG